MGSWDNTGLGVGWDDTEPIYVCEVTQCPYVGVWRDTRPR